MATRRTAPTAPTPASDPITATDTSRTALIMLSNPIVRAGGNVTQVTLRKPSGGDLRGFSLQAVINSDVDALIGVVPRISQPYLTEQEVAALEADDFAEVGGALFGFFMKPEHREQIARMNRT